MRFLYTLIVGGIILLIFLPFSLKADKRKKEKLKAEIRQELKQEQERANGTSYKPQKGSDAHYEQWKAERLREP